MLPGVLLLELTGAVVGLSLITFACVTDDSVLKELLAVLVIQCAIIHSVIAEPGGEQRHDDSGAGNKAKKAKRAKQEQPCEQVVDDASTTSTTNPWARMGDLASATEYWDNTTTGNPTWEQCVQQDLMSRLLN